MMITGSSNAVLYYYPISWNTYVNVYKDKRWNYFIWMDGWFTQQKVRANILLSKKWVKVFFSMYFLSASICVFCCDWRTGQMNGRTPGKNLIAFCALYFKIHQ